MISFIIPTKNEEKVIEKTLKCLSIYSKEHEIILSDGNSTDSTITITQKYTDKISIYKGATRQTIGAGRNAGVLISSGDLLVFLDADISILDIDSFMQAAQMNFDKDPNLVAMTVRLKVFPEMATSADNIVFGFMNFLHRILNNVLHIGASPGEFMMIRTTAFKKVGGFTEYLAAGEDYDIFRRLRKVGRTYFENRLTVYHTGRRAHAIGWPKLLMQWGMNNMSNVFLKKSVSKEWKEIR
jgi:glycosyltransferase involved in cell wall biosynthesis